MLFITPETKRYSKTNCYNKISCESVFLFFVIMRFIILFDKLKEETHNDGATLVIEAYFA